MKKMLAVLACLAMMLTCCAALAETDTRVSMGSIDVNGAFELVCTLPDGYTYTALVNESGRLMGTVTSEAEGAPAMMISIAFDEMVADVARLNDMDEERLAAIEATYTEEDQVEISYTETSHGTKLMVIREALEGTDFVSFYTVYAGYSVEFVLVPAEEGGVLTDEQIQLAVTFLSDVDFVAVTAE